MTGLEHRNSGCDKQLLCQLTHKQCDQIGRFLEVLGNKFSNKSSPNTSSPIIGNFLKHVAF